MDSSGVIPNWVQRYAISFFHTFTLHSELSQFPVTTLKEAWSKWANLAQIE